VGAEAAPESSLGVQPDITPILKATAAINAIDLRNLIKNISCDDKESKFTYIISKSAYLMYKKKHNGIISLKNS
jgi:hypothetical protein